MAGKRGKNIIPPYGVFFTWDIHFKCNFRCPYCFFGKIWDQLSAENRYPGIDKWLAVWDDVFEKYGACNIHITGGEPFIYPDFLELISSLSKKHFLEFDTNLSLDAADFISRMKPQNVRFAATFHPAFAEFDSFLDKVCQLKGNGFDIRADYVAYPPQLERLEEYSRRFRERDVVLQVIPFRGEFSGRTYPGDYTEEEKKLVRTCSDKLVSTETMLNKFGELQDEGETENKVCRMGQMYAKIRPDGTAHRCCKVKESGQLGNMLDGSFELLDEATPCEYSDDCNCWRPMIVGEEDNWSPNWIFPVKNFNNVESKK